MVDPVIAVGGAVTLVSLAATAYLVFRRSGGVSDIQITDNTADEVSEAVEAGEDFVASASETVEEGTNFANEVEGVVDDVTGENDLENVKGIGPTRAESFQEEGFENPDDLYYATDENLTAVERIGELTVSQIREDIGSVDNDGSDGFE